MKRIIVFILIASAALAQTFIPNVSVEGSNLNAQEDRTLDELRNTIEQYISSNSFSNEQYELFVPFRINIFVTQIGQSGSKKSITANAFFSNEYDQRYIDNVWTFEFSEGENLYREMIYHPLRDVIDYYGYLIMATEMDGIEEMGGNSIFDLANEIYSRGSSSRWSSGWKPRKEDFDRLTGDFRLRKARYLYNQAFWALDDGQGTPAWYFLEEALINLNDSYYIDSQNKFLDFFIDKHYQDAEYFVQVYQDTSLLPLYRSLAPSKKDFFDTVVEPFEE